MKLMFMNKKKIKIVLLIIISIFSSATLAAKEKYKKDGKISFVTSQNIYVRFENTEGISSGDTAYYNYNGKFIPVMVVKFLSTTSCSGEKISKVNLKVGDNISVRVTKDETEILTLKKAGNEKDTNLVNDAPQQERRKDKIKIPANRSNLYGSFTANSFSGFANYANSVGTQSWRYTLNLHAENIGGSPFTFTNYMNFSYLTSNWSNIKTNVFNNLKIYDLSIGYKVNKFSIWLGRHMNNNISSVGPIDGLQVEKGFGKFAFGGVIGSRPDFLHMGLNSNLFEYGAYINRIDTISNRIMQSSVAIFQQSNHNKTDRRFLYLQHNNNIVNNLYLFFSSEIDLFKLQNNKAQSDFSLTSLYLSTQYTPVRLLTINLSYDARRSVIYYETFKSLFDSLFENQLRQGLRLSFFIRPFRGMFLNLGGGYSFQKGDIKPSRNFNISVTKSDIPFLDISASLTFNRIFSSYQSGSVYGITLTKYIPFNSTTISAGVSKLQYNFGNFTGNIDQKILTLQISTKLVNHIYFNIYYEGDFQGKTTFGRLMAGINYRF
ncbi:MAG: hypothetical protein WAM24_10645 [Ignavibacteriaceae bacterium]